MCESVVSWIFDWNQNSIFILNNFFIQDNFFLHEKSVEAVFKTIKVFFNSLNEFLGLLRSLNREMPLFQWIIIKVQLERFSIVFWPQIPNYPTKKLNLKFLKIKMRPSTLIKSIQIKTGSMPVLMKHNKLQWKLPEWLLTRELRNNPNPSVFHVNPFSVQHRKTIKRKVFRINWNNNLIWEIIWR